MLEGFERFKGSSTQKHIDRPITISKDGCVYIKAAIYEYFQGYQYVELNYNKSAELIEFKPINSLIVRVESMRTLTKQKNTREFKFSCRKFLKEFNIMPKGTIRLPAEWDNERNVLVIDGQLLKEGGEDATSN